MTELRDLEARIRALEDLEAIKTLKHEYFYCIDRGLWDEIGDCFAEDAWTDYGPDAQLRGRAVIAQFFKDNIAPGFSLCMHMGHNPKIKLTSDTTATGLWELDNYMVPAGTNGGLWIGAFYEDEYIKENGEWKIQGTRVIYHFRSDMDTGWAK